MKISRTAHLEVLRDALDAIYEKSGIVLSDDIFEKTIQALEHIEDVKQFRKVAEETGSYMRAFQEGILAIATLSLISTEVDNQKKTLLNLINVKKKIQLKAPIKISTDELCYLVDIIFNIPEVKQRLKELGEADVNTDDIITQFEQEE